MRTADFDYHLPPDRIAQRPAEPRDASRLLVLDRETGRCSHHGFGDLPGFLSLGDALVLNQTRVLAARLHGKKIPGGGKVELLLIQREGDRLWQAMVGGRGLRPGVRIAIPEGPEAEILADLGGPLRRVRFEEAITPQLDRLGEMPLPPYIHTPLQHNDEYQTVFARFPGSAAAPTAGLHFTPQLLEEIEARGVRLVRVTLHLGMDTFVPVTVEDPEQHTIHREWCRLTPDAADELNAVRNAGGRIVAVGTTTVRTLETAARAAPEGQAVGPIEGLSDLFILPGFVFGAVDAMVTNFHLPRSTLLMMISAFAGRKRILQTYQTAVQEGYRFYSFGDAMLIL
ncbi:MAG TPA: tRNA preQ1(34) S-adenosylmethionine ribosyltransferase-isomerase QueA [Anaerolineae bacterium]|nr:tRNA preQ1(34) S-adenosylmethionine ribosyltransferase-isomerase QueA [Anaerolineae bacterium]